LRWLLTATGYPNFFSSITRHGGKQTVNQIKKGKRWVEMHFPQSEMRIDPRLTNQNKQRRTTTKHKNGAGVQRNKHKSATNRSDGNSEGPSLPINLSAKGK